MSRFPAIVRSILPASVLVLGKDGKLLPGIRSSPSPVTSTEKFHGASVLSGVALHCLVCEDGQAVLSVLYQ